MPVSLAWKKNKIQSKPASVPTLTWGFCKEEVTESHPAQRGLFFGGGGRETRCHPKLYQEAGKRTLPIPRFGAQRARGGSG